MDALPAIAIVHRDPEQLASLLNALERRFGADYRVVAFLGSQAALEGLARLGSEGVEIALVISCLWLDGELTGREVLGRAHLIDPRAKRALLVAWGDRRSAPAILQGCAFGELDNYLLQPWIPPEVHLYPQVSEFLAEWTRDFRPRMELVHLVARLPSPRAHELRELLQRNGVPLGFRDADAPAGRRLLEEVGAADANGPVLVLPEGRVLVDPSNAEVADALGASTQDTRTCDVAIVGAGPAGLAAAVYAASEGLRTLVIEREAVGGQAGTSSLIRNYLGFPRGISGAELAQRAYQQAWLFGAKYVFARAVTRLEAAGEEYKLALSDGRELAARAVLVATGASWRRLGIPELERFVGAGLYYTAMPDPLVTSGRDVMVVGGGNSAGQATVHLARQAHRVLLVVRGDALGRHMSDYLVREIAHLPNVEVRLGTELLRAEGTHTLDRVVISDRRTGALEVVQTSMVFVLIGAEPHTEWLAGTLVRDRHGFIVTGRDLGAAWVHAEQRPPMGFETSLPGVFAVGDVRAGSVKRVASAVGEGAIAVRFLHDYLGGATGERTGLPLLRPPHAGAP